MEVISVQRLLLPLLFLAHSSWSDPSCSSATLAVYRVTFQTFWDRENFPRQYPEWRPPAQWAKLTGEIEFLLVVVLVLWLLLLLWLWVLLLLWVGLWLRWLVLLVVRGLL